MPVSALSAPSAPPVPAPSAGYGPVVADVLRRVPEIERLVASPASWHVSSQILQARRWHRVPCLRTLALMPLDARTHEPLDAPRRVTGRDVSLGGLSFVHLDPLPCSRVTVTFALEDGSRPSAVLHLTWCRFTRRGIYHSGGLFVGLVERPHRFDGLDGDWDLLPHA